MKQIENKQNRYGSPILAGYSDQRMHFVMFLGLIAIVLGGPDFFFERCFVVLLAGGAIAYIVAKIQQSSYRSELLFKKELNRLYHMGENAERYEYMLNNYKSLPQIIKIRSVKKFRRLKRKMLTQYQNSTIPRKIASLKITKQTKKVISQQVI